MSGCSARVLGCIAANYACAAVIYGDRAAIYGDSAVFCGYFTIVNGRIADTACARRSDGLARQAALPRYGSSYAYVLRPVRYKRGVGGTGEAYGGLLLGTDGVYRGTTTARYAARASCYASFFRQVPARGRTWSVPPLPAYARTKVSVWY